MGQNQAKCNKPPARSRDAVLAKDPHLPSLAIESPEVQWLEHLTGTQGRGFKSHLGLGFFPSFHLM